eukprot:3773899-Pleurochrysis_carterae.AAC.1
MADDGVGWEQSLVSAKAIRDWWEVNIEPLLARVTAGQSGPAFRVSTIGATPSTVNFPTCAAVVNHVNTVAAGLQTQLSQGSGALITPNVHSFIL